MDNSKFHRHIFDFEKDDIINELIDALEFYANEKNWRMTESGSSIKGEDITQVVEMDYIDRYGGKKARQTLKELGVKNGV